MTGHKYAVSYLVCTYLFINATPVRQGGAVAVAMLLGHVLIK